jgi:methylated-DNA-[protein]-cysteine S-methyltransferase
MTPSLQMLTRRLTAQRRWNSPLGEMLLARSEHGLAGAWFSGQKDHPGALSVPEVGDDPLLERSVAELDAYFGSAPVLFSVPLDLYGTPFQRAVWQALLGIHSGSLSSYGAIAAAIGAPSAVRAVGAAIGRNPVSVIVPCHRVIGSSGALTGYAGGIDRKRALLRLERPAPLAAQAVLALDEAA